MVEKKYTKIFFRIFPMEKMIWDYLKILDDNKTIYIRCLQELAKSKENVIPTFWTFRADNVFFNHNQKQVYDEIVPEVFDNVMQGYDGIIIAYGQTGTGKSLTVNGLYNPYEDRGILPRVTSELFHKIKADTAKNNIKVCIQVSYVEFPKNGVNDLLKSYPNQLFSLKDINKIKVKNVEEALKVIFKGEGRKIFSENSPYESHSFSSIFTFYISTKNIELQDVSTIKCKLHIVDLAGADTVGNFSCIFKNALEIGAANLAKTQLEQFFLVLCSDIPEHIRIKQRLNPMILYLGDSLRKNSLVRLIGHIKTTREDLLITISMLRFGQLVGGLKSTRFEVKIDKEVSHEKADRLQKELDRLKLENQYNTILMHQDLSKSLNEERFAHIERTVNEYLENKITRITLLNVCDIDIAFEILRMICQRCESEKVEKELPPVKSRKQTLSGSHIKVVEKSSRSSNIRLSSGTLTKKSSEDKKRDYSTPAELKTSSKTQTQDQHSLGSRARSRTSSNSLMKRTSTSKKKSGSNASIRERSKSNKSHESMLTIQIPPEYTEAWNTYLTERNDEYLHFGRLYQENATASRNIYKTYVIEINQLREASSRVDKHKNDLLMARMTREFQQANSVGLSNDGVLSDFEKCCKKELEKSENDKIEKQELVLKIQAELKAYINICKDAKKDLEKSFYNFCKEKYQTPPAAVETQHVEEMDIVDDLIKEQEVIQRVEDEQSDEAIVFEKLKPLIDVERRKKKLHQLKNREWMTY